MQRVLLIHCLFLLSFTLSKSQIIGPVFLGEIEVGYSPIEFIYPEAYKYTEGYNIRSDFYVICAGWDENGNGQYDEPNDIKGSIWKIENAEKATLVHEYENSFPRTPAHSFSQGDIFVIPMSDSTTTYYSILNDEFLGNLDNTEIFIKSSVVKSDDFGINLGFSEGKDRIYFNNENLNSNFEVPSNALDFWVQGDKANGYSLITSHYNGANDYRIYLGNIEFTVPVDWESTEIVLNREPIEITSNPFDKTFAEFYVVPEASDDILVYDATSGQLNYQYTHKRELYGDINNLTFFNESTIVASCDKQIVFYLSGLPNVSESFDAIKPAHAIFGNSQEWVFAMPLNEDGTPNNTIGKYGFTSSVNESENTFFIHPNIITNEATLQLEEGAKDANWQIYDTKGQKLSVGQTSNGTATLTRDDFHTLGHYFIRVGDKTVQVIVQ